MMYRLCVLCSAIFIAACSSNGEERPEYLDSYSVQGLEVPPTLTSPDTSKQMILPTPSEQAMQLLKQREDYSIQGSVAPIFKGIELKSNEGLYWLQVPQDADKLWPLLQDFWAHEGIKLERNEALLGFMETEWIKEYDPRNDASFIGRMFSKLSPDRLDKFRLRIERVSGQQLSRIFISHRGLEVFVHDNGTSWRQRASDAELEREMLHRLVLFAGLSKLQADEIFSTYIPYQARIRALSDDDTFEISGKSDYVWDRVIHAVNRIGVEIIRQDRQQGLLDVKISNVPEKLVNPEDDLDESSWLVRMFTGGPGDEELEEGQVTVNMKLTPKGHSTQLQLRHAGDALPAIGLAARFEEALVNILR